MKNVYVQYKYVQDKFEKTMDGLRAGELPSGLRDVGMGLGANGAPLTNISQLLSSVGAGAPAQINSPPGSAATDLRLLFSFTSDISFTVRLDSTRTDFQGWLLRRRPQDRPATTVRHF